MIYFISKRAREERALAAERRLKALQGAALRVPITTHPNLADIDQT